MKELTLARFVYLARELGCDKHSLTRHQITRTVSFPLERDAVSFVEILLEEYPENTRIIQHGATISLRY